MQFWRVKTKVKKASEKRKQKKGWYNYYGNDT